MQSKFKFSFEGTDATARQFREIRRALSELSASVGNSFRRLLERIGSVEAGLKSLADDQDQVDAAGVAVVVAPPHGGTGVRNVSASPLSTTPRKSVYCGYDGSLGVDCSRLDSMVDVRDADGFVPVDALRQMKWRIYLLKDDVNLKLDDAQPVIGLIADDLDDAGLGFFCEYDEEGKPVGVDYAKLSVAALRLSQEAMDELDELRALVGELTSKIDRIGKTSDGDSDR